MEQDNRVAAYIDPLYQVKGWIKFAGIMSIITGAFQVLTIWGILFAWLPIWMGVLLVQASGLIEKAHNAGNEQDMRTSFQKLGSYFKIYGIMMVVLIVVAVLGIIAAITIPAFMGMRQAATGGM